MATETELAKIKAIVGSIQGWASHKELAALYDAAKNCSGKGAIVEIGSWKGRSTVCLGLGSLAGKKITVYAIDPHTGSPDHITKYPKEKIWTLEEFKNNVRDAGVENIIETIINTSEGVVKKWKEPIELLYLDVNYHDYELSKQDFLWWSEKVVNGGAIAIHNTYPAFKPMLLENQALHGWPAPRKVLNDFVFGSKNFKNIRIIDDTTIMEKCEKNNWFDRLMGRMTQLRGFCLVLTYRLYLRLTSLPVPVKKIGKRVVFLFWTKN